MEVGVFKTKERFPHFPFLFSPLSLSTLKGLSAVGGGAARWLSGHWLPGSGDLHIGSYKSGGGAPRRSSSPGTGGGGTERAGPRVLGASPSRSCSLQTSPTQGSQQACSRESETHAPVCKPERALALPFGIALGAWRHESCEALGQSLPFSLAAL